MLDAPSADTTLFAAGRAIPLLDTSSMLINFLGPPSSPEGGGPFTIIPFIDVLNGTFPQTLVKDKIVLIGLTVRGAVADVYGEEVAQKVRVQYGGSANPTNIGDYMSHPDIDGALVGGASLKAGFVELVRNAV